MPDALDWANVPDPDAIPTPHFTVSRHDDDTSVVFAQTDEGYPPLRVGEVYFNGAIWMFIRVDRSGGQVMDGLHYIPVDPDTEQEHRDEEAAIRQSGTGGAQDPLIAALELQRKLYRDDSRYMAEVGGIIEARKWWKLLWSDDS